MSEWTFSVAQRLIFRIELTTFPLANRALAWSTHWMAICSISPMATKSSIIFSGFFILRVTMLHYINYARALDNPLQRINVVPTRLRTIKFNSNTYQEIGSSHSLIPEKLLEMSLSIKRFQIITTDWNLIKSMPLRNILRKRKRIKPEYLSNMILLVWALRKVLFKLFIHRLWFLFFIANGTVLDIESIAHTTNNGLT